MTSLLVQFKLLNIFEVLINIIQKTFFLCLGNNKGKTENNRKQFPFHFRIG